MNNCTYNLGFEVFYDDRGRPQKFKQILNVENQIVKEEELKRNNKSEIN